MMDQAPDRPPRDPHVPPVIQRWPLFSLYAVVIIYATYVVALWGR